jgi:hypothetical protein
MSSTVFNLYLYDAQRELMSQANVDSNNIILNILEFDDGLIIIQEK